MTALLCFCTCPDLATAERLATTVVDERLAACVNLLPQVHAVYRWEGRVQQANEVLLLAKSTRERFQALRERLLALHPYELPEIVAVEIDAGLPAYLHWIAAETGAPDAHAD